MSQKESIERFQRLLNGSGNLGGSSGTTVTLLTRPRPATFILIDPQREEFDHR